MNPISGMDLKGTHSCKGDWRIGNVDRWLHLSRLIPLLQNRSPILIDHSEICWKFKGQHDYVKENSPERYNAADITIPGIVVFGAPNPDNSKYRMIDGVHRMSKRIIETQLEQSLFYILNAPEFFSFLEYVTRT